MNNNRCLPIIVVAIQELSHAVYTRLYMDITCLHYQELLGRRRCDKLKRLAGGIVRDKRVWLSTRNSLFSTTHLAFVGSAVYPTESSCKSGL